MNETLSQETMNESKLRNKHLKGTCEEDQQSYKKERHLCVALY